MTNEAVANDVGVFRVGIRKKMLEIGWRGRRHKLKLSRGLEQLVWLMHNPGFFWDYAAMESDAAIPQARYHQFNSKEERLEHQLHSAEDYPPIPLSDAKALRDVKKRLLALISEEAELDEFSDYGRLDDIRDEKEALTNYLSEVYSPAKRVRNFSDESAKQRKRVQKNLLRAVAAIGEVEPELATMLKSCLNVQCGIVFHTNALVIEVESH